VNRLATTVIANTSYETEPLHQDLLQNRLQYLCTCALSYASLYLIIYDTSAKKSLNISEGSIAYCSTVCVLGFLGDDTLIDEINVAPVLALCTLSVDKISRVADCGPESATSHILLPCVALSVEKSLASDKSIIVHSLKGPFTNKNRELSLLGDEGSLTAHSGVNVVGVSASGSEVVDVRVEDDVGGGIIERSPEACTLETILDHEGNALIKLGDLLEDTIVVGVDPVRAVLGKASSRTEASKVV
jgi:hypothetical protein